jgi:di/tricarboxylate transporter
MTLIGTPPNILAASIMQDYGVEPFAFFDFLPTGFLVLGAGVLYMMLVGRRLIPDRIPPGNLSQEYHVRDYLTEVQITAGSQLIGKRIKETDLGSEYDLDVVYVNTHQASLVSPSSEYTLEEHDILLLKGRPEAIVRASEFYGFLPTVDFTPGNWSAEAESEDFHLAEITLAPNSSLERQTLAEINFRDRYGLSVLAVRHDGVEQVNRLSDFSVRFGDSLLVQGPSEKFKHLLNDSNLLLLESPSIERRRTQKIPLAAAILLAVLISAALGLLPVAALMLAGALFMVLGGVLRMDEAYRAIDWKAVFLIAGMLPLGTAMEKSGTAQLMADQLVAFSGEMGAVAVLMTIFVSTALLTEVISNAAAAVLVVPIAIDVAISLSLQAQPFVMATVIAASTSFLMPIGHQVNIIIFGAGGYKFFDYARVGVWLNLILLLMTAVFVPLIWPF